MTKIRVPKQKRSIEKRDRIVEYGFKLMCENGYYKTDTAAIAKYAGVSTGIVYSYFENKKDIFIAGIQQHVDDIILPIQAELTNLVLEDDLSPIIKKIIKISISNHYFSKRAYNEILAMSYLDEDIKVIHSQIYITIKKFVINFLKGMDYDVLNLDEKCHLIIEIIDNYSHEYLFESHTDIDYEKLQDEIIDTIIFLLQK